MTDSDSVSEGKARYIVLLSKKVYTKATTVNTGSWRSLVMIMAVTGPGPHTGSPPVCPDSAGVLR